MSWWKQRMLLNPMLISSLLSESYTKLWKPPMRPGCGSDTAHGSAQLIPSSDPWESRSHIPRHSSHQLLLQLTECVHPSSAHSQGGFSHVERPPTGPLQHPRAGAELERGSQKHTRGAGSIDLLQRWQVAALEIILTDHQHQMGKPSCGQERSMF